MASKAPLWKKILKILFWLVILLAATVLTFAWFSGAWNLIFPSNEHETQPPWISDKMGTPAVLIFTKTNSFRHIEGIEAGNTALREIIVGSGWDLYSTENGAIFNDEDLQRFDTVVFLNASGDILSTSQQLAFQNWLEAGGGWIGIHAAGDGSHAGWSWYMENLIGAEFTAHIMGPQFQRATVVMEAPSHPVVPRLPNVWTHTEEWYSWKQSPRVNGFTVLAAIDETSYVPLQKFFGQERDLSMGDHPVVWTNCVGEGRALYSALGHKEEAFLKAEYRILLEDALKWTMGLKEGGC
jgi:type 1 glutamine amidotransferase